MHRTRTTPVPEPRRRFARRVITAMVAVAFAVPATAEARRAEPSASFVAAPGAAIAVTQLAPGTLRGVAATSSTNAWAVGTTPPPPTGGAGTPLILHWNGSDWTRQATPALPGYRLSAVAARSPSDAWAVGDDGDTTLALHWNGSAWSRVATPAVGELEGVAMLSARNVWAVGETAGLRPPVALVLHWNGHVWKRARVPKLRKDFFGGFLAVSASSARNVWAVGAATNCGCGPGDSVVMHFNGRSWKRRRPPVGRCCFSMLGVATVSSRRAFVVGVVGEGEDPHEAQAARFNGRRWRRQHTPSPAFRHRGDDFLGGVAATSSTNAWAVGTTNAHAVLVERWNGRAWRQVRVQAALSPAVVHDEELSGVAATSRRNAWAVGTVSTVSTNLALILHWNGASWSPVPTAP